MVKKIIAITAILAIASGLAGCGETGSFLSNTTEQEKTEIRSDEVFIPIEKIRTLNPIVSKDEDAYYVDKLIYEGLFGYDRNLSVVNVLAASYSYAEDGTSLTVNLKQGIKWQDGKELTAEDVKFTMDVIAAATYSGGSLYSGNISNVKYTKINRKDPYQIVIYFNNPTDISLCNFTFPILAEHQFKNIDAAKRVDSNFIPVGTGPYRVSDYNELSHITLVGYDQYHGEIHPANTLDFQVIPEKRNAINLMDVNNISVTFSKDIDRDTIYTNKEVHIVNFPSNEAEIIGFNFRTPSLKDSRVRKAIACAIDRQEIIESAYFKNGVISDSIYYPDYLGVQTSKGAISFDIDKAKAYLREAGCYDKNGDGLLEDATGQDLTINLLVNAEDQSRTAAAQIIQESLGQLSIKTNIISKEWAGYNSDLASGNFDIFIGGYQFNEKYDLRFLLHSGTGNPAGYSNPSLDVLLDQMESGISKEERQGTYVKINTILSSDMPYFCLMYKTYGAIASPSLKGAIQPSFLNFYLGAEEWYSMIEKEAEKTPDTTASDAM